MHIKLQLEHNLKDLKKQKKLYNMIFVKELLQIIQKGKYMKDKKTTYKLKYKCTYKYL